MQIHSSIYLPPSSFQGEHLSWGWSGRSTALGREGHCYLLYSPRPPTTFLRLLGTAPMADSGSRHGPHSSSAGEPHTSLVSASRPPGAWPWFAFAEVGTGGWVCRAPFLPVTRTMTTLDHAAEPEYPSIH